MNSATFVLSTGRCGTQWLADHLAGQGKADLAVEHEPLGHDHLSRKQLGGGEPVGPLATHLDEIERLLETRSYVECGHPCWSSIPLLARRFSGRVRFIHLARHPVPTAYSWLTHQAYCPPFLPHIPEKVLLSPFDEGVLFPEYQEQWSALSPFEKALYYWTEVNAAGLKWQQNAEAPWLQVSYEGLFGGNDLAAIHAFLGINADAPAQKAKRVDQFHYIAEAMEDWRVITKHPRTMETAQQLGYDPLSADTPALIQRYLAGQFTSSSP